MHTENSIGGSFFLSNSRNNLLSHYDSYEDDDDDIEDEHFPKGDTTNTNHENDNQNGTNNTNQSSNRKNTTNRCSSRRLMSLLGRILLLITTLLFLLTIPSLAVLASIYKSDRAKFSFAVSAAAFVFVTVILSTKLIYHHLTNWYMPDVQKYVVRLLWLVPLYAVQSLASFLFQGDARIYIDTARDLYEAFVIQSFLYYLVALLGGEERLVEILRGKDPHLGRHDIVTRLFVNDWEMGLEFLLRCKFGVIQYVLVKTLATVATAVLQPFGLYGEGEFTWWKGYGYISTVMNFSQCWALYCLVFFYHATADDLKHPVNWRPMGKFLCVKGVVFFTWWQGLLIEMLRSKNIIRDIGKWSADDVASGLQDYLICVEMFCFAVAHSFTFTHLEYIPGNNNNRSNRTEGIEERLLANQSDDDLSRYTYDTEERNHAHEDEDDYFYKAPPTIRTLDAPMGFRDAFWSSTSVPNEALSEIKRFRNGVEDRVRNEAEEELKVGSVAVMQYAESL